MFYETSQVTKTFIDHPKTVHEGLIKIKLIHINRAVWSKSCWRLNETY